jgi:hypothetical protein
MRQRAADSGCIKEPLPEGFEKMYVISVGGIPLNAGSRSQSSSQYPSRYPSQHPPQQQQDDSPESDQKILDRMRAATLLEPKDKCYLQPALLVQQPAGYGNVYFGFAKDIVTLRPEDREVGFSTQFGQIQVNTKFWQQYSWQLAPRTGIAVRPVGFRTLVSSRLASFRSCASGGLPLLQGPL